MQKDYISGYSARDTASGYGGRVTLSEATTVERRSGNQVFYTFKTSGSGVEVKCPIPSLPGENWMQGAQRGYAAAHFAEELGSRFHSSPQTENDAKAWMSHYFNSDPSRNCGFELKYVEPDSFHQPIVELCASRMGKCLLANRSWAFTGAESQVLRQADQQLYFDPWGKAGESHTIKYRVDTSQPKLSELVEHESERLKAALRAQLGDEPRRDVSYFNDYWKIVRSLCHTFGSQATYYPHSFPDKDRSRRVVSYQEDGERGTSPSADEIHAGLVAYVQSRERRGEQPHNQPPPLPPPPVGMRPPPITRPPPAQPTPVQFHHSPYPGSSNSESPYYPTQYQDISSQAGSQPQYPLTVQQGGGHSRPPYPPHAQYPPGDPLSVYFQTPASQPGPTAGPPSQQRYVLPPGSRASPVTQQPTGREGGNRYWHPQFGWRVMNQ